MKTIDVTFEDETITLPAVWALCPECDGEGTVDHPAFSNGITASEWAEDWDDESRETYLRGGYDVACPTCHRLGRCLVVDYSRLTADEALFVHLAEEEAELNARFESESRAYSAMERAMGC